MSGAGVMPPAYLRGPLVQVETSPYAMGCTGKLPQTRHEARQVTARRASRQGGSGTAYRCLRCGWWHTSQLDGPIGRALAAQMKKDRR